MSIAGIGFWFWRIMEIITLIPTMGMMAYFVHAYVQSNILTPNYILLLFITATLAAAWTIATLMMYATARHSAVFVCVIDLGFIGCLIASLYYLRGITERDCVSFTAGSFYYTLGALGYAGRNANNPWSFDVNKNCAMLKASFAFGCMNCVFFAITALLALGVAHHHRDRVVVKERRHSRHRGSHYSSSPRRSHHSHRYHV